MSRSPAAVVKVHPKDASRSWSKQARRTNLLIVEDISIHDVIDRADVVIVHSSNVGLEALMLGKPVIVMGTPYYSNRGLTFGAPGVERIAATVGAALRSRPRAA